MTGADGQHVQLFASSTGTLGNGPWSVVYNGRLYAQYDDAIARAIGKLFGGRLGEEPGSGGDPVPSSNEPFSTSGAPAQLFYGLSGLLTISDSFSYQAVAAAGAIAGGIRARNYVTDTSALKDGAAKPDPKLTTIKLTTAGHDIDCKIRPVQAWDDSQSAGAFTCPIPGVASGDPYRYPIIVTYLVDGQEVNLRGELVGTWRSDAPKPPVLPASPEITAAFAANPIVASLLTDHILGALIMPH